MLFVVPVFAQLSLLKVSKDSVAINTELRINNKTKDTRGVLVNTGNGNTVFQRLDLINVGDTAIAIAGQDTLAMHFSSQSAAITGIPDVSLAAKPVDASTVQLKWWKSDAELYNAPKIGVIGDSQGKGDFASSYANSIIGRLQTYINAVASNAQVTNYCQNGYNSRKLAPTGSNTYVDVNNNITKALADGNNIIVLVNTSNDFAAEGAGGELSLEEAMANTILIAEACSQAGAQLIVVSSFPRQQETVAERQKLHTQADNLLRTFGDRCAYVYHLIEDPAYPDQLLPAVNHGDDIHLNDLGCQIVFNALRNTIAGYFTSNTNVAKYVVQQAAALGGPFADYQTLTAPGTNTLSITKNGKFYRVRIFFQSGYYSNWSNIVTADGSGTPVSGAPLVNAGSTQNIISPASSVTLAATATALSGHTISGYSWTKVSGGNATISTPAAATTAVTGLVQGSYVFRCTATDDASNTGYGDVAVNVLAPSDGVAKFNFNATPQNISGWVDVSGGPMVAGNAGKQWTDPSTGFGLVEVNNTTTVWGNIYSGTNSDNNNGQATSDGGGFATDAGVIASAWYSNNISYTGTGSSQFKLVGLNSAKKYMIKVYCSLSNNFNTLDANPTQVVVNNNVVNERRINALGNTSQVATFTGVKPSAAGEIPLFVGTPAGEATFGMINGLSIVEDNTTGSTIAPTVNAGSDVQVNLPQTSATLSATITTGGGEPTVQWTKVSGATTVTFSNANGLQTTASGLTSGTYVLRCTVTDTWGHTVSDDVSLTVSGNINNTSLNIAFSRYNFSLSNWLVVSGYPGASVVNSAASMAGNIINISTVNTANWVMFSNSASDSTGETVNDGGGFVVPARVVQGNFFNVTPYSASTPQISITNLPAGTYKVTLFGSISNQVHTAIGSTFPTTYRVNSAAPVTVDATGNTSKTAVFTGVTITAGGTINVFANPQQIDNFNYIAGLNAIILEKTN